MLGAERGQQPWEVERPERLDRPDEHPAGAQPAQRVEVRGDRVDLGERPPRAAQDRLPGLRHADRAARALKQFEAQLALEAADLLAERGLRDVQLRGRAREVALLGDGGEVAQLAQLHAFIVIAYRSKCNIVFDE